jgi:hypothetical protein
MGYGFSLAANVSQVYLVPDLEVETIKKYR